MIIIIHMGMSECTMWWPFKGIKEIKREEGEKWQKGGRVSDCERGENADHLWSIDSMAKRALFHVKN